MSTTEKGVKPSIREDVRAVLMTAYVMNEWLTASEIAARVGHRYASATVTAKLRELRKARNGGLVIACVRCPEEEGSEGGYVYRYLRLSCGKCGGGSDPQFKHVNAMTDEQCEQEKQWHVIQRPTTKRPKDFGRVHGQLF